MIIYNHHAPVIFAKSKMHNANTKRKRYIKNRNRNFYKTIRNRLASLKKQNNQIIAKLVPAYLKGYRGFESSLIQFKRKRFYKIFYFYKKLKSWFYSKAKRKSLCWTNLQKVKTFRKLLFIFLIDMFVAFSLRKISYYLDAFR